MVDVGCLKQVLFSLSLFFLIYINFDLSRHYSHVVYNNDDQDTDLTTRNGFAYDNKKVKSIIGGVNDNIIDDIGVGEWIMDTWIPPEPWKFMSPSEIQIIFSNYSMLWMGDSLSRRAATTLYGILNSTMDIDPNGRIINNINEGSNRTLDSSSSSSPLLVKDERKGIGRYTPQSAIDGGKIINVNKGRKTELCNKYKTFPKPLYLCRPMPVSPRDDKTVAVAASTSELNDDALVGMDKNLIKMEEAATHMATPKEFGLYWMSCVGEIEHFARNELNNVTKIIQKFLICL